MKQNRFFKNYSQVAISNIVGAGLQGVFYFVFAFVLIPKDYGLISYSIGLAGTVSVITRFGLPQTITVFKAKNQMNLTENLNTISVIGSIVSFLVLVPFDVFAGLLAFGLSLFITNVHNFLGEKNYRGYTKRILLKGSLIAILPMLFYFFMDFEGIILGMAIGNLAAGFELFSKTSIKKISLSSFKSKLSFIIHNFTLDASADLWRSIDKLLIAPVLGFATLGIYQFNLQIVLLAAIVPTSFYSYLLSEESTGKIHRKNYYFQFFVTIVIVILGIFLFPLFVNYVFPKFSDGILALQLLLVILLPMSINAILNAKLQAMESRRVGYSAIIKITSLIILLFLLGNLYGITGLSLSLLISTCIESLTLFYFYKKLLITCK